jgi:hypothetical protein
MHHSTHKKSVNERTIKLLFFVVLLAYSITEISFLATEDLTADETSHLSYGARILQLQSYKRSCTTDDSKMPVSALNALPRAFQQLLHPHLQKNDYGADDARNGRYITFLFSLLTLILIFKWSSLLYGEWAGVFSMALTAFCPNFLAHSGLVTTDAYSALALLLVLYTLWRYTTRGNEKYFIAFCIFTGLAQLVKQTFFHLYILLPLMVLLWLWINKRHISLRKVLVKVTILAAINILIINIGFLFYKTGQSFQQYVFVSKLFNTVQHTSGILGRIPLPFPEPFLYGMDTVKYFDELGSGYRESTFGIISILGHREPGKSYWFYYIVTMFFKTPLPVLLFGILASIKVFAKNNRIFFKKNESILLFAFIYFIIIMSLFNHIQAGVRHVLFLYPLLYILCGKLISISMPVKMKLVIAGGFTWLIISVYSYFNSYISYTNELIPDKKNAYKIVGNANLDFGQGYSAAIAYMKNHPDVHLPTAVPQKGKFLISIGKLEDNSGEHTYNWLQPYEPIAQVHHSFLVIEVK